MKNNNLFAVMILAIMNFSAYGEVATSNMTCSSECASECTMDECNRNKDCQSHCQENQQKSMMDTACTQECTTAECHRDALCREDQDRCTVGTKYEWVVTDHGSVILKDMKTNAMVEFDKEVVNAIIESVKRGNEERLAVHTCDTSDSEMSIQIVPDDRGDRIVIRADNTFIEVDSALFEKLAVSQALSPEYFETEVRKHRTQE